MPYEEGLYSLRRRQERDPMEGPLFPNTPGPPIPSLIPVSPSPPTKKEDSNNSLNSLLNILQKNKEKPASKEGGENVLADFMEKFYAPRQKPLSEAIGIQDLPGTLDIVNPGRGAFWQGRYKGVPTHQVVAPELFVKPGTNELRPQAELAKIEKGMGYGEQGRWGQQGPSIGIGEATGLKGGTGAAGYLTEEIPNVETVPQGGSSALAPEITGHLPGMEFYSTKGGFGQRWRTDQPKEVSQSQFMDWLDTEVQPTPTSKTYGTERNWGKWDVKGTTYAERVAAREAELERMGFNQERLKETTLPGMGGGGRMIAGQPYRVGEYGEEIVFPETDATVIPNDNSLLNFINARALKDQPVQGGQVDQNALLRYRPSPDYSPDIAGRSRLQVPETPPVVNLALPEKAPNALLRATAPTIAPVTQRPTNSLLDYWAKPIIGGIPRDQFVQMAGMVAHALAPRSFGGRLGAGLAQIGGAAYKERVRREGETPTEWGVFYKDWMQNNPGGKIDDALKAYHAAISIPKVPTPHYVSTIQKVNGVDMFGNFDVSSKTFTPIRNATEKDIADIQTGKIKEPKEYEPHSYIKPDGTIGWVEPGKEVPKGWKPYEKEAKVTPHWETVKDPKSPTGWSRQDMNNPTEPLRTGAPAPSSVTEKEKTFKDKQIEAMWPKLSDEEKKKVVGAGVDPHELTEKNILDMYGNIFTDPAVRKSIQPIAEEIIKRATQKPIGKVSAPGGKVINELPKGAKFHGYGEDGKKIYIVPPATAGGKPIYIKEQ